MCARFSDSLIERLHYQELHRLYREDADIANRCIWQVIEEERRLHNWVVSLGQGSAEERMAMLMIDFQTRLEGSGMIPEGALQFHMPLTQQQLADHLGLTAIHVNRVLKAFARTADRGGAGRFGADPRLRESETDRATPARPL